MDASRDVRAFPWHCQVIGGEPLESTRHESTGGRHRPEDLGTSGDFIGDPYMRDGGAFGDSINGQYLVSEIDWHDGQDPHGLMDRVHWRGWLHAV
jgi:hypothetical protein